jgi:hypothetical protein
MFPTNEDKTNDEKKSDEFNTDLDKNRDNSQNIDNLAFSEHKVIEPLSALENLPESTTPVSETVATTSTNSIADEVKMMSTQPPVKQGVVSGGIENSELNKTPTKQKKPFFKKFTVLPIAIIATLLIIGGVSAATYYTVIIPNNPEMLWKTSLSNSAKGLEKLSEYQNKQSQSKGMTYDGTFDGKISEIVFDGNINGKTYESNSETKVDVGAAGTRYALELKTIIPENANNPDIYFKVSGVKGLAEILGAADPELQAQFGSLDSQWYFIDHTLLDQLSEGSESKISTNISSEDMNRIFQTIVTKTNEYVLSTDEQKAVVVVAENVGAEKIDERDLYHYKVQINKDNFKSYIKALSDSINQLNIESIKVDNNTVEDINKSIDSIKETTTADIWVDKSNKLIRKFKFTDPESSENSVEISLNYNGGDTLPLLIKFSSAEKDNKSELSLGVDLNTKDNSTKLTANFSSEGNNDSGNFGLTLNAKPNNEPIDVKTPEGAKSILELIGGLSQLQSPEFDDSSAITRTLGVFDDREL